MRGSNATTLPFPPLPVAVWRIWSLRPTSCAMPIWPRIESPGVTRSHDRHVPARAPHARARARRHIEDGLPQWMVTPRAYPNRRLREPFRAPKKIHRQIRQPVRQGNTLLVRQFAATAALYLLQERPLDRIGGGLVCGFAFVAVAPLLLGGREGHAAYAGMVTLPSSSPVHSAVRHGERGVVFIEEFREPAPPESPAVGDSYPLATLLFCAIQGQS